MSFSDSRRFPTVHPKRGSCILNVLVLASLSTAAGCASQTNDESPAAAGDATRGEATREATGEDSAESRAQTNPPAADGGVTLETSPLEGRSDGGNPTRCSPGPGATGNPSSILEVVELINSLPMPVTLPCLLQSLERPITLTATTSVISAQPANGHDNPRLFLFREGLSLSVVPAGDSAHLLEIGELTSNTRSIKGEIEFPVAAPLDRAAPFHRIARPSGGTVCYVCHHDEVASVDYPADGAFESIAYRPVPGLEVNFDYVEYQYTTCDEAVDRDRCAFYAALFDQGGVSRGEFPAEMPTFE